MRRYLTPSLHTRAGQPARFARVDPAIATPLALAGVWAMFGDSTGTIAGCGSCASFQYGNDSGAGAPLLAQSPIGLAIRPGQYYGNFWWTNAPSTTGYQISGAPQPYLYGWPSLTFAVAVAGIPAVQSEHAYPLYIATGNGSNVMISLRCIGNAAPTVAISMAQWYNPCGISYPIPTGENGLFVATMNSGVWKAYWRGADVTASASITNAHSYPAGDGMDSLTFLSSYVGWVGGNSYLQGAATNYAAMFKRVFSPTDVAWLSQNYWRVFA